MMPFSYLSGVKISGFFSSAKKELTYFKKLFYAAFSSRRIAQNDSIPKSNDYFLLLN
jgi:hypothetical protein